MLREERPGNLNNAAALGLMARAQESWGDGFTGLDGFGDDDRENTSGLDSYENDMLSLGVTDPANEPYTFDDRQNNQYNGLGAAEALAEGIRLREEGQLARALVLLNLNKTILITSSHHELYFLSFNLPIIYI